MAVDGLSVEGDGEGSSLNPNIQADKYSEKAREKGWKPLEEFEGDESDWVDAKEFVGRQKLYDRINDLKTTIAKQTSSFQRDMQQVVGQMSKVRESEYKRALKTLERQRAEAVEQADVEAVVAVSKEIETLKEEKIEEQASVKEGARTTGEATPEFLEWQANNKWFQENQEMRQDAISIGVGYAAGNPNKTQTEVLDYVTKKVKRMYPETFEKKEPKNKVDSKVESSGSGRQPMGVGKKMSIDDLPEDHRVIAKTIIKSGALKKSADKNKRSELEEYVAQYQSNI